MNIISDTHIGRHCIGNMVKEEQESEKRFIKIIHDNDETFGPMLMVGYNGTRRC